MRWWLVSAVLAAGCAPGAGTLEHAQRAAVVGDWDAAVRYYERALAEDPDDIEIRMALQRAFIEASRLHLSVARERLAAGDAPRALESLERAFAYDPTNRYVRDLLLEQRARAGSVARRPVSSDSVASFFGEEPVLDPGSSEPLTLHFPEGTSLRTVLESLAKLASVSILFDESFRDQRVSVDLNGVTFQEALDILTETNGLFYKVVSSSSVVVNEDP